MTQKAADGASAGSGLAPEALGSSELVEKICSVDVCEVFSPPRVGLEANKYGLQLGDAMDLTTGGDFNREDHRIKAERYIEL